MSQMTVVTGQSGHMDQRGSRVTVNHCQKNDK